jgi:hypothetical protein
MIGRLRLNHRLRQQGHVLDASANVLLIRLWRVLDELWLLVLLQNQTLQALCYVAAWSGNDRDARVHVLSSTLRGAYPNAQRETSVAVNRPKEVEWRYLGTNRRWFGGLINLLSVNRLQHCQRRHSHHHTLRSI